MGTVIFRPVCNNCKKVVPHLSIYEDILKGDSGYKYNSIALFPKFCPNCGEAIETLVCPNDCRTINDYNEYLKHCEELV